MEIYFRNEREFSSYQVTSLQQKHSLMNSKYERGEYGEAVNYARTLIESTCSYVYHELTDCELEKTEGRHTKSGYYIGLHDMIKSCLNKLTALMEYPEKVQKMSTDLINLVDIIGNIRNNSATSHGGRHAAISTRKSETRFIISIAEDVCMMLMDLLHERTILEKDNAIGSVINMDGLKKYDDAFQSENDFLTKRFLTSGGIIYQVDLTFNKKFIDQNIDSEFINDHILDYLPDDIGVAKLLAKQKYQYHSDRQDRDYTVSWVDTIRELLVYVSGL
ncbi:hypothetical protein Lp90_1028 [Lactiplantibacillus plantarum]|uniref:abortive infection family protein n=1 Tax=Lactiplantibacillus plantarum TaxID=1590 RepID=UPI0004DCE7F4|nr:abortive infection family protein [Lactiplantibacillus plantarum]KEZ14844.1 hypothetical protein Lp90_1028 [Lactiplantibacillus plantarum]KZU81618.1 hypothetical protein Nizo3892_1315 [Lactiplantibacillus plantarum]